MILHIKRRYVELVCPINPVSRAVSHAAALRAEPENFRAKINIATGHDSYGAGAGEERRVGGHDDLVLSVAVALWVGESVTQTQPLVYIL